MFIILEPSNVVLLVLLVSLSICVDLSSVLSSLHTHAHLSSFASNSLVSMQLQVLSSSKFSRGKCLYVGVTWALWCRLLQQELLKRPDKVLPYLCCYLIEGYKGQGDSGSFSKNQSGRQGTARSSCLTRRNCGVQSV